MSADESSGKSRPLILVVDDEPSVRRAVARVLESSDCEVMEARDGPAALATVAEHDFDAIVSDVSMPGFDGVQLLREVRRRDLDVPVILMTGAPNLEMAIDALNHGAFHFLVKPYDHAELVGLVRRAVRLHLIARIKREALKLSGGQHATPGDRAGLEASFESALNTLWMAYQPILAADGTVFGYEALLRSREPTLPNPLALLQAARRLDRIGDVTGRVHAVAAEPFDRAPDEHLLFVNLDSHDLVNDGLFDTEAPLVRLAHRVVLEITERMALDAIPDVADRVSRLRKLGFRIAVDDLGAGYAGLTSFVLLQPEIVKLDMTLVRDAHQNPTKQRLIASMASVCDDLGMQLVGEGVETVEERDCLVRLGCDLLQGYLFAKPGPAFPDARW